MLTILSTLATKGALPALVARFEASTGAKVATDFAPTNGLLARIKTGEAADVAILTRQGIDVLAGRGMLSAETIADLARSFVGIAVKEGARKPDIGTAEAFRRALLEAKSIAYSRIGASGVFFAGLIQRLGIADAVNAKATIIPSGLTAELAARGDVELAVQQLSELMLAPGVDIVGPLPATLQTPTTFSAAVFAGSVHVDLAREFLHALSSAEAAAVFKSTGLEPVR